MPAYRREDRPLLLAKPEEEEPEPPTRNFGQPSPPPWLFTTTPLPDFYGVLLKRGTDEKRLLAHLFLDIS
jgi:hypothetical protein